MSKKRLLSAGCSLVYGAELSDCADYHGDSDASLKTWPALIAKRLGYEYYTCSLCGVSNQGITRHVIDVCERYEIDAVIIQWTFCSRYELRFNKTQPHMREPSEYSNLDPWMSRYFGVPRHLPQDKKNGIKQLLDTIDPKTRKLADLWFDAVHSDDTAVYNYLRCCTEMGCYLKWKGIPFVFASTETDPSKEYIDSLDDASISSLYQIYKLMPTIDFAGMGFWDWCLKNNFDFGIDHPLDDAHAAACNLLLDNVSNFLQP